MHRRRRPHTLAGACIIVGCWFYDATGGRRLANPPRSAGRHSAAAARGRLPLPPAARRPGGLVGGEALLQPPATSRQAPPSHAATTAAAPPPAFLYARPGSDHILHDDIMDFINVAHFFGRLLENPGSTNKFPKFISADDNHARALRVRRAHSLQSHSLLAGLSSDTF